MKQETLVSLRNSSKYIKKGLPVREALKSIG
jgi:hypothetical protein